MAFPCGSRSIRSTFFLLFPSAAAILMAEVVFPTPPFWLASAMIAPICPPSLLFYVVICGFCGVFSGFSKNSRAKTLFRTFLMPFRRFYKVFTALFDAFSVFSAHPATVRRGLSPMLYISTHLGACTPKPTQSLPLFYHFRCVKSIVPLCNCKNFDSIHIFRRFWRHFCFTWNIFTDFQCAEACTHRLRTSLRAI